jgi:RNA polymerase sigma-70 factor (ECF subfamily)
MSEPKEAEGFSLERLATGDRNEFARLVDQYSPLIYRLALKILANPEDAEDVLQETFLKAYQALPTFEGRSRLSTWLYRIAVNEALMLVRRRKAPLVPVEDDDPGEDELERPVQLVDWCCLPEHELLSGETRGFLDAAVERLPDTLRTVFVLRDIQGWSIRETAEALNLSEVAVKTRLLRARLKLRETLSGYFGERVKETPAE